MKFARVSFEDEIYSGVVEDDILNVIYGDIFESGKFSDKKINLKDENVEFLSPVQPSKIILAGLNYMDHARELNKEIPDEPVIFLKPVTSLIGHKQKIIFPPQAQRVDYEAELALVVKADCKNISEEDAHNYIFGFTALNDVTERDIQTKDGQWTRAKGFDTFCPVGPYIITNADPDDQGISCFLNNNLKQNSSTKNFIFSSAYIFSFVSKIMSLKKGDIISTGTPGGIGPMRPGDTVEVKVGDISLINYVSAPENGLTAEK